MRNRMRNEWTVAAAFGVVAILIASGLAFPVNAGESGSTPFDSSGTAVEPGCGEALQLQRPAENQDPGTLDWSGLCPGAPGWCG